MRKLERAGLENMLPVWDDGRMIMEEGHLALKDEMKFATRRYRAPYGLEQVEMRQEGKELDAAGPLYVALTEYKKPDPTTPSPLSVGTPGDKRSGPVEDRFRRILERRRVESGEESMVETLSEAREDLEVGNTPEPKPSEEEFTTERVRGDKVETSNIIKSTNILKARAGGRQELEGLDGDKEVESVMITATPQRKYVKSRKRKREVEGWGRPSADAVSEKNLRETASMVLSRWKTTAYKSSYEPRKLLELEREMEVPTNSTTKMKRGSTSGQTWEVDVGKEWVSNEHQATGKQVTSDPLEKKKTRNTSRP